ncbi:MAG: DUF2282 domain-containing protein [Alphaproteobacteria bacterium]|nr:DUF2282 domain-containing protein [Alphaproteobacteria bacterium]
MKTSALVVASAVATALSLGAVSSATAQQAKNEKCYGIVKATKNDCQTATSSCAGTAKKDAQADAWLFVPAGTCEKIVGASLKPKS